MQLINLTPHALNFTCGVSLPPSGVVARVSVSRNPIGEIEGVPAFVPTFGDVTDLPDFNGNDIFVVSAMVKNHPSLKGRSDVCSPGQPVRNDKGEIIGADGLDF